MSYLHGPNNKFKNEDLGCRNPTISIEFEVRVVEHSSSIE